VQYLKGRSSRLLQEEYPNLKKRYWGQHLWWRGYFCVTVGEMTKEMIKAYIEDHQEEETPKITVHGEFQS
jgi:putative transposase